MNRLATPIAFSGSARAQPERRLFIALLEDAVCLIRKEGVGSPPAALGRHAEADLAWLCSNDRHGPCSFLNVCSYLSLDPDWIRAEIRAELPPRWRKHWALTLGAATPHEAAKRAALVSPGNAPRRRPLL